MSTIKPAAACLLLAGCATITEGTDQRILVEAVPANATCVLSRAGERIGASLPGARAVIVSKSRFDIDIVCSAPGYQDKSDGLSSKLSSATVASILLLDFGIVDNASGAAWKYPTRLTVVLDRNRS